MEKNRMTAHEKQIIIDIYDLTKEAYKKADTKEKQAEKMAQCFAIMHIMQTFGFWEDYLKQKEIRT